MPGNAKRKELAKARAVDRPLQTPPEAAPAVASPQPSVSVVVPSTPEPPALPALARPDAGHIAAAVLLSVVIAAIYGTISWGMFIGSVDYKAHIDLARRMYESGRPSLPHFFFHGITVLLYAAHVAPSLVSSGRLVLVGCYLIIGLSTYSLLWVLFQSSRIGRPAILFCAGLAMLLAEPITSARAYALGYFWPEPYQIPTSTALKPFALIGFACTVWYLNRRPRMDWRLISLFAAATLAGTLSKPSFVICIVPAAVILIVCRLVRGLPVSLAGLAAGLFVPAAVVLAWQFYSTYLGPRVPGMYHDSVIWAPLKFMSYWATGLVSKFFLTIAFPLAVAALYWKEARRDTMMQLAWLCFAFGAGYSYLVAEKINWSAGNFAWSGGITAYTLFVASTVFWLGRVAALDQPGSSRTAVVACGSILALHALSGARIDWLYLTHYGCSLDFRNVDFICGS